MEKIYWDSDCFLGYFQDEEGKVEKCDGVLQRADRGDVIIVHIGSYDCRSLVDSWCSTDHEGQG